MISYLFLKGSHAQNGCCTSMSATCLPLHRKHINMWSHFRLQKQETWSDLTSNAKWTIDDAPCALQALYDYMTLLFWNLCRSLKCLKSGGWHLSSEPRFEEEWCCLHKDIPIRIHPMFPPLLNEKWMPTLTSKSLPTQSLTGQAYFAECPSQQAKTRSRFAVALQAPCLYAAALPTCNQCINWPVKSQELLTNIGRHHVPLGHGDSAPNEFGGWIGPTTPNGGSIFDKAVLYWYILILYYGNYTRPISSQPPMKPWDPALVSLHPHAVHGASGWSKPGTWQYGGLTVTHKARRCNGSWTLKVRSNIM